MKQSIITVISFVVMLALTGCSQNNGDSANGSDIKNIYTSSASVFSSLDSNSESTSNKPNSTSTNSSTYSSTISDVVSEPNSVSTTDSVNSSPAEKPLPSFSESTTQASADISAPNEQVSPSSESSSISTTSTNDPSITEKPTSSASEGTVQTPLDTDISKKQIPPISDIIWEDCPRISEDKLNSAIDAFPLDTITLPDGSSVSKYDAVSADHEVLIFEFAFYRNASPIYNTTLSDPDLITYTNGFWESTVNTDDLTKQIVKSYKKAAKGDLLECGLSVENASCRIDINGEVTQNNIYLNGSITVPGIINYLPEDDIYVSEGTIYLRPDSTKAVIPILHSRLNMVFHYWDGFSNPEDDPPFYMYFDSGAWVLGSIYDSQYDKFDLQYAFADKTTIPATVTVTNLKLKSLGGVTGEITDIHF